MALIYARQIADSGFDTAGEECFECGQDLRELPPGTPVVYWAGDTIHIVLCVKCAEIVGARLIRDGLNGQKGSGGISIDMEKIHTSAVPYACKDGSAGRRGS